MIIDYQNFIASLLCAVDIFWKYQEEFGDELWGRKYVENVEKEI